MAAPTTPPLALHRAVWEDDRAEVARLLGAGAGAGLEERDRHGRTPLMLAVSLGRLEVTRSLLQHQANVNTECDGWTVVQVRGYQGGVGDSMVKW